MSNGAKGERFVCANCACMFFFLKKRGECVDAQYTCMPTGVFVCVWVVVGHLTHTEGELYPLYVLHRKRVYSSCLCVAARFEMESITSFPGKRTERHERREKAEDKSAFMTQSPGSVGSGAV